MKRLFALIPCILVTACAYNQHTYEQSKGVAITQQQVTAVETGKTTKQWILTHWGIPDRTQMEKDGLEVFEYVHERAEASNKSFIFLFNIDSNKVIDRRLTRVVLRDEIVTSVNTHIQ